MTEIVSRLKLPWHELEEHYRRHLLLSELLPPEVSLVILRLSFLSKRCVALQGWHNEEARRAAHGPKTYQRLNILEDRYINGVLLYMLGTSSYQCASDHGASHYFREAYRLFSDRSEDSLNPEELFCFSQVLSNVQPFGYKHEMTQLLERAAGHQFKYAFSALGKHYSNELNDSTRARFAYERGVTIECPRCMYQLALIVSTSDVSLKKNLMIRAAILGHVTAIIHCRREHWSLVSYKY